MRKVLSRLMALVMVVGLSVNVFGQDNQPSPSDATSTSGVQTVVTPAPDQAPVEPVAGSAVGGGCVGCGGQVMSTMYGGGVYGGGCSGCGSCMTGGCNTMNACNSCNTCDRNRVLGRRDNCCNVANDCGRRNILNRNNCCQPVSTCCNTAPSCNTCNTCNAAPVVNTCCNTVPMMSTGCCGSAPVVNACNTGCGMPVANCGSVQPMRVSRVQMMQPRGTFVRLGGRR